MSLSFEVAEYPRYQTKSHYGLFTAAWSEYFSAGAQAKIPVETFRNLYENNPAGRAVVAVAREGEAWAGAVAAIPFRVRDSRNHTFLAYQISDIMVSPVYRRRGAFSRLLKLLTDYLTRSPEIAIFVFPNRRSRFGCIECGYRPVKVLPTRIYFPGPASAFTRLEPGSQLYRRFGRPVASYREIDHEEAARIIDERDTILPRLIRDRDYLKWRYFQPPGGDKFQLLAVESIASGTTSVVVTTRHRYGNRDFLVFLELLPQTEEDCRTLTLGLLLSLGRKQGAGLLYSNEKIAAGVLNPAGGMTLPRRLNPRPIELLVYPRPGNRELEKTFLQVRFATADWLGFL